MLKTNIELINNCEELLQKNRDAEKGYAKAAIISTSSDIKYFFRKKSDERRIFNISLKNELVRSFEAIKDESSFDGAVHRTWMDIKSFLSGNNDKAMLEEAIRGDEAAIEEYDHILLKENLPISLGLLIKKQKLKIQSDLDAVKKLRKMLE